MFFFFLALFLLCSHSSASVRKPLNHRNDFSTSEFDIFEDVPLNTPKVTPLPSPRLQTKPICTIQKDILALFGKYASISKETRYETIMDINTRAVVLRINLPLANMSLVEKVFYESILVWIASRTEALAKISQRYAIEKENKRRASDMEIELQFTQCAQDFKLKEIEFRHRISDLEITCAI